MTDHNLVRAIIDLALFLERSNDSTVEPDAAVDALENLAEHLQAMDRDAKEQFTAALDALSKSYGQDAAFVEEFASNFGLED